MLDAALDKIETALLYLSAVLIFCLMIFIVFIIFARVIGVGIVGYIDVIELTLPAVAILAISHLQRRGEHLRMDLLVTRIRSPRGRKALALVSLSLGLAVSTVLCVKTYAHFARAFEFGDSTIDAETPTWPSKGLVPVALAILSLRLVLQIVDVVRDRPTGEEAEPAGEGLE